MQPYLFIQLHGVNKHLFSDYFILIDQIISWSIRCSINLRFIHIYSLSNYIKLRKEANNNIQEAARNVFSLNQESLTKKLTLITNELIHERRQLESVGILLR